MVQSKKTTKALSRRERRSGKERIRRQQPPHISARIKTTTKTIVILLKVSIGSYI
jgi:hypothetical protein